MTGLPDGRRLPPADLSRVVVCSGISTPLPAYLEARAEGGATGLVRLNVAGVSLVLSPEQWDAVLDVLLPVLGMPAGVTREAM